MIIIGAALISHALYAISHSLDNIARAIRDLMDNKEDEANT